LKGKKCLQIPYFRQFCSQFCASDLTYSI
jgi:hypothetical protein